MRRFAAAALLDAMGHLGRERARQVGAREVAIAATAAGTLSGLPSTLWAAVTGRDILEATRAAGTLVPGRRDRPGLVAGGAVHCVVTLFWTTGLAVATRRRGLSPLAGAAAGLAIATLDLGVVGRRYPAINALPAIPQLADHMAFGALAAVALSRSGVASGQRRRP